MNRLLTNEEWQQILGWDLPPNERELKLLTKVASIVRAETLKTMDAQGLQDMLLSMTVLNQNTPKIVLIGSRACTKRSPQTRQEGGEMNKHSTFDTDSCNNPVPEIDPVDEELAWREMNKPPILTDEQIQALEGRGMLPAADYDREVAKAQRDDTFRETLKMVGEMISAKPCNAACQRWKDDLLQALNQLEGE